MKSAQNQQRRRSSCLQVFRKAFWLCVGLLAAFLCAPCGIGAEIGVGREVGLKPMEVAVLAVKTDLDSMRIAEHYMNARAIPAENLILLEKSYPTDVSRSAWEEKIRPQIRARLAELPSVKCLVCAWALPLRIGAPDVKSESFKEKRAFYNEREKQLGATLRQLLKTMCDIAPNDESRSDAEKIPDIGTLDSTQWRTLHASTVNKAKARIMTLPSDAQSAAIQELESLLKASVGLESLQNLALLHAKMNADKANAAQILKLLQTVEFLEKHIIELNFHEDSLERDKELMKTIRLLHGPYVAMNYARDFRARFDQNEGRSAFDSELSLIFEPKKYTAMGWLPNMYAYPYGMPPAIRVSINKENPVPSSHEDHVNSEEVEEISAKKSEVQFRKPLENEFTGEFRIPEPRRRVLLVARLEGPTPEMAIQRIDEGIATEKEGLKGAVYLDARMSRPMQATPGTYAKMEQSINDLAIRLQRSTDLDVRLDTKGELFKKSDCATPCALYCGWYSLRNFQDIFTFSPGAVAYHVASCEAESLRNGPMWCPNLISHGAVATLGPTFEPYLSAFPEPDEFYSLVLTGKFTMIECYYYTSPFNSWAMTYVGDPLYTPFRATPKLKLEDMPKNLQRFFGIKP